MKDIAPHRESLSRSPAPTPSSVRVRIEKFMPSDPVDFHLDLHLQNGSREGRCDRAKPQEAMKVTNVRRGGSRVLYLTVSFQYTLCCWAVSLNHGALFSLGQKGN